MQRKKEDETNAAAREMTKADKSSLECTEHEERGTVRR